MKIIAALALFALAGCSSLGFGTPDPRPGQILGDTIRLAAADKVAHPERAAEDDAAIARAKAGADAADKSANSDALLAAAKAAADAAALAAAGTPWGLILGGASTIASVLIGAVVKKHGADIADHTEQLDGIAAAPAAPFIPPVVKI